MSTSMRPVNSSDRVLSKTFEWFEEEVIRWMVKDYKKVRNNMSWHDFVLQWEEKVKEDALRLRSL